jgi:hypothetical protein
MRRVVLWRLHGAEEHPIVLFFVVLQSVRPSIRCDIRIRGTLSDIELDTVRALWAKSRMPGEVARLAILEEDEAALALGAAVLRTFQRGCSDQALIAADVAGIRPGGTSRGAPGPMPRDRSRSLSLEERAKAFHG